MLGRMPLLKTLLFTVVVPGTVVVLVPRWLMGGGGTLHGGWLGAAGALLLVGGAALYLRCAWEFAVRGRGTPAPVDPPRELIVAGAYRYVRNGERGHSRLTAEPAPRRMPPMRPSHRACRCRCRSVGEELPAA